MKTNNKFKGITYSVVAIVALVGVLGVLAGIEYKSLVGSNVGESISERAAKDMSVQKLEDTKATVSGALQFSSMSAALDVAEQGGTSNPITYWECNSKPTPPEMNEVLFALSNTSAQYLNAYLKTLKTDLKEKNIDVTDCDCVSITPPKKEDCMTTDCASFGSGAKNEKITVTKPTETKYEGDIEVDNNPIRFWMFYYRLYDYFKNNKLLDAIIKSMHAHCPEPPTMKYEIAYKDVCKDLIRLLSKHDSPTQINCTTIKRGEKPEIFCTHKYINCRIIETGAPHTDCEREPNENTCFEPGAYLQGSTKGIVIELTDKKFKPLGARPMVFNINAVFVGLDVPECKPINGNQTK